MPLALLCDPTIRALAKSEGDDPDKLVALYVDALNRAVAGRPADMTIALHLCRGNMGALWMGDGGYAPIGEALFGAAMLTPICSSTISRAPAISRHCGICPPASAPISASSAPRRGVG